MLFLKNHPILNIAVVKLFLWFALCSSNTFATSFKDSISPQKALFNKANKFKKDYQLDSAYHYFYSSYLISKNESDSVYIAKGAFKLAIIDYYHKDYNSSEHHLTETLKYAPLNKRTNYSLYCYNLMGLNLEEQLDFKEAIYYFNHYRETYLNKKDTLSNFITYSNNMGKLYQKTKEYPKAVSYFNRILQVPDFQKTYPIKYARALDNKAWSLFQINELEKAFPLFVEAKEIRTTHKNKPGLVMSYYHLGRFFQTKKAFKEAVSFTKKSLQIADSIGNIEGKLKALFLLSQIDAVNSHSYFKQHKEAKEILLAKERQFKDQTARIRYETSKKEAEIQLQKTSITHKNRTILWALLASGIFALSAFVFFIQKKKISRQKENILALQKEVHHTAKNNLNMALRFISKMKEKPSPETIIALEKRIQSMSVLHELLYKKEGNELFVLQEYIQAICETLHQSYTVANKDISYTVSIKASLTYKKASKLGIIVNELVTNIYKHAFATKKTGQYRITADKVKGKFVLTITDNGVGFPKDFNLKNTQTYGLMMTQGLAQQIGGNIEVNSRENTTEIRIIV